MTPAGTSNELDVQIEWEENTHNTQQSVQLIPKKDGVNLPSSLKTSRQAHELWKTILRVMYYCIIYGDTYCKSMDQPGTVANPARAWSAEQGKWISLSPFAPENLVSQDGFGSLVPPQPAHLHAQAESGAVLLLLLQV